MISCGEPRPILAREQLSLSKMLMLITMLPWPFTCGMLQAGVIQYYTTSPVACIKDNSEIDWGVLLHNAASKNQIGTKKLFNETKKTEVRLLFCFVIDKSW